jgi:hypothetical protein
LWVSSFFAFVGFTGAGRGGAGFDSTGFGSHGSVCCGSVEKVCVTEVNAFYISGNLVLQKRRLRHFGSSVPFLGF